MFYPFCFRTEERREAARRLEEWREGKRRKEVQEEEQRLSEEIQKRKREKVLLRICVWKVNSCDYLSSEIVLV